MSKSVALLLVLVFLTASCVTMSLPANAGSKTIVVPDDYPTISSAIGNATDGDTILVKKGTYQIPTNQTLRINKPISLIGEDVENTIISLNPGYNVSYIITASFFALSDAIIVDTNDVKLSGFTISLQSPGGYISVTGDRIEISGNNFKTGGSSTGLRASGSHCNITENTSGGLISLSGSSNIIARNSFSKIYISGNSNTISNNTCWNLRLSNANQNVVSGNKIGTTTRHSMGVYVVGNSSHNVFYANNIAGYSYDVEIKEVNSKSENNTFYHNNFLNNSRYTGVGVRTGNFVNFWDNGEEGNYWEDYNGTDANRDGIGDVSYVIDGDNIDNYPLMAPFDIENDTVVLPPPEPFPTTLVAAALVLVAVVGIGLIVHFKKRNH